MKAKSGRKSKKESPIPARNVPTISVRNKSVDGETTPRFAKVPDDCRYYENDRSGSFSTEMVKAQARTCPRQLR